MEKEALKEKLALDLREVIADTEELLKITAADVTEKTKEIREKLSARLEDARAKLSQTGCVLKDKASIGVKEADRIVRSHPYESLGTAFGVGILLGVLLNRR